MVTRVAATTCLSPPPDARTSQVQDEHRKAPVDVTGPLNALEAERYCEELRTFAFEELGGPRWMQQHEFLTKLNIQAHVNAAQQRDEFVLEAFVLHEKIPLLIRELIVCELWKQNGYPLLREYLGKQNSIKGYLLIYHEAVIINLLEALLYHKEACDAAGDLVVELCDYAHRKLVWLHNTPPPPRPKDKEALKAQLMKETQEEYLVAQERSIATSAPPRPDLASARCRPRARMDTCACFVRTARQSTPSAAVRSHIVVRSHVAVRSNVVADCAISCLSIMRFMTDHLAALPLAVTARLLDTYDLLMLLSPILEVKPWQSNGDDGEQRRFINGMWQRVPDAELNKMHKAEAQVPIP